jgi:hypothetical protein
MSLPRTYRFTVKNETGQTIAANSIFVYARRWNRNSVGKKNFESSEATIVSSGSTLATGSFLNGTTQDNSTLKWDSGAFQFTITAPASSNGNVVCTLQRSTDGGTDFDTDGLADIVAILNFTATGTKTKTFQIGI